MVLDMESGERAALVSGHSMYTEEAMAKEPDDPSTSEPAENTKVKEENILGQFHEDALRQVGVGSYQWLVCTTAGFCFMADGAQMFIMAYLVPSIQAEMCLEDTKVLWLNVITIIGLLIGALLCPLADHMGRRSLLVFALTVHLLFNISAAFTPTFGVFITARFGSSVGLGICYPVACVYFSEFLPHGARNRISWLLLFWALGGAYALSLAYFLLPSTGEDVVIETREHHSSWHRVLLLTSLPSVFALASMLCVSETARYLLHAGKDVNAIMVYQQMYKWNASRSAQYQLTELELPSKPVCSKQPPAKSVWAQMCFNISTFFQSLRQLGQRQNLIAIVLLSMVWASMGFSYYGLAVWIPGRIQWLKDTEYKSKVEIIEDAEEYGHLFNTDMDNRNYSNVTFKSCTFAHMTLSHVTFRRCSFNNVEFTNILSSRTYFIESEIENSRFIDTDLTDDRFLNCVMGSNNTMLSFEGQCRTDLDFNIGQDDLLRENTLRLACPFIALAINALLLSKFKRINVAVGAMLVCSLASLLMLLLCSELTLLCFDALWSLIFVFAFNAANIITSEAFPVHLRATGFGVALFWFRAFGLNGAVGFGVQINEGGIVIPALSVVTALLVGGVALFRMTDTAPNLM